MITKLRTKKGVNLKKLQPKQNYKFNPGMLIKLRLEQAIPRTVIAARMGCCRATIQRWENKETVPSAEDILKLGDIFSVSPYTFYNSVNVNREVSNEQ